MPEYLSPGVYVEEIEIGARPIEGVSTSTAGFVGMAERGPLNKPTLVTSFAEYQRTFGGYLSEKDYAGCRFLPYAVEGFFANGGKRAYITRVALDEQAAKILNKPASAAKISNGFLPNICGNNTSLAADVGAKRITLKLQVDITKDLAIDDVLLLKGTFSEYLIYRGSAKALNLGSMLKSSCKSGDEIKKIDISDEFKIKEDLKKEATEIALEKAANFAKDDKLIFITVIGSEVVTSEVVTITEDNQNNTEAKVSPLKNDYSKANTKIYKSKLPLASEKLISDVRADRDIIPIISNDLKFNKDDLIEINEDYFIIQSVDSERIILLGNELAYDHKKGDDLKQLIQAITVQASSMGSWGNQIKIEVKDDSLSRAKLKENANVGESFMVVDTVVGIEAGSVLKLPVDTPKYVSVAGVVKAANENKILLKTPLSDALSKDKEISTAEFSLTVRYDRYEESFKGLSLDEEHSRFIKKAVPDGVSSFVFFDKVKIDSPDATKKVLMPTAGKEWTLSGGQDGVPASADEKETNTVYIGRDSVEPKERNGLYALQNIDEISIVAIPGITSQAVAIKLIEHCELMKDRFAVLDSKKGASLDEIQKQRNLYDSRYAALYYPWISVFDPLANQSDVPPSGHICGIYARSDTERGVHKAPANEVVRGAMDLEEAEGGFRRIINKGQQDILNPKGINCIRAFPGRGIRVWGARTISSDSLWKYINVRRLFLFIEESIDEGTQWVVFEPNDEKLWARVKQTINQFLTRVWKDGALMGATQDDAFFVRCDRTTMTQDEIDNGKLIVLIGVAPVKPAEFVIFRIAQVAKGSQIAG